MRPDLSPLVTPSPALQAGDLLDPAQFKAIFLLHPDHEFESYPVDPLTDEQLERLGGDAVYLRFSHMLVFQHALAHEELKPLIAAFCEELVEFSDEYGLKRLYVPLLNIYRDKDKVDPDDPAMFAAREKKIAAKLSAAVELLEEEHRETFLSFI
ncbi:hypothetical protein [Marinobacter zhejiangensis]|uniref:Uncharacterized protein n=1 Tax=Marinobacter zhejiangensis TaxID=488535 RepID=A0A1I4P301_9GAMM|nr:hypothetical protein [Marinobacter zhejiangensis]SFM22035.1 hypothetical protein SAMN04487963_1774 [Marinobacter zhejiangensis]